MTLGIEAFGEMGMVMATIVMVTVYVSTSKIEAHFTFINKTKKYI